MPEALVSKDKRVHIVIPIRVSYWDGPVRTAQEVACTYDIHNRGARICGLRNVREVGEIITVERGRNKALFRVSWIGDQDSGLRGQYGIECVEEERLPWLQELQDMEETYELIAEPNTAFTSKLAPILGANRRRGTRYLASGVADVFKVRGCNPVQAAVGNLSDRGCMLLAALPVLPGADVRLQLPVFNCDLSLQGQVRYTGEGKGSGIEFRQIRRGDRPLLELLLRTLAAQKREAESWSFEEARAKA